MPKSLCKLKKSRKVNTKDTFVLYPNATHVCSKCGRVADSKKKLCKPVKLADQ